jgi:hypothetical protein
MTSDSSAREASRDGVGLPSETGGIRPRDCNFLASCSVKDTAVGPRDASEEPSELTDVGWVSSVNAVNPLRVD